MKTKTLFAVMLCCLIFSCSVARTVAEKYPTEEEAEFTYDICGYPQP